MHTLEIVICDAGDGVLDSGVFLASLAGCSGDECVGTVPCEFKDDDEDGFNSCDDCDDNDPTIHPAAEEICDEVDNNCNDQVDEGGVCPELNCTLGDVVDEEGNPVPPLPQNERQFESGEAIGAVLARSAWEATPMDPAAVEDFAFELTQLLLATFPTEDELSDTLACRVRGLIQGAGDELQEIFDEVELACTEEGASWGVYVGQLYCDLSLLFGPPVANEVVPGPDNDGLCGGAYENSCVMSVEDETQAYGDCVKYTENAYLDEYEQYRDNVCLFDATG
ncbi:MAG: hypothetical protein B7733_24880 [Myxococcales bacterium FL481]|nr:MAG: hypothetical protein B7733_24880 [Myxococcales bacterium FL481]